MIVNGTSYDVSTGFLILLHSFHVFRFENDGTDPMMLELICYPYPEMALMSFRQVEKDRFSTTELRCRQLSSDDILIYDTLINKLRHEYAIDSPDRLSSLIIRSIRMQLNHLSYSGENSSHYTLSKSSEIFLYVCDRSFFSGLTIQDVCLAFSCSRRDVEKALYEICMADFSSVLQHARLSNAYSMMLHKSLSLTDIAIYAGFSSDKEFSRIFRQTYSEQPSQYRKRLAKAFSGTPDTFDEQLLELHNYILSHYRDPVTVADAAEHMSVTAETVHEILRRHHGDIVDFGSYLKFLRLHYAEGLLTMSDMNVLHVAYESGFNSIHTFIRNFKDSYGMPPTEFRNRFQDLSEGNGISGSSGERS